MSHTLLMMGKCVSKVSQKAQILVNAAASGRGNLFIISHMSGMKSGAGASLLKLSSPSMGAIGGGQDGTMWSNVVGDVCCSVL